MGLLDYIDAIISDSRECTMPRSLIQIGLFLALWMVGQLQAMTLERVENDLYATGPTVDEDFLNFREAFEKGGIQRLILVNAPGGDLHGIACGPHGSGSKNQHRGLGLLHVRLQLDLFGRRKQKLWNRALATNDDGGHPWPARQDQQKRFAFSHARDVRFLQAADG